MGRMAVYDLVDKLDGKNVLSRRVPVSLCVRESCGCQEQLPEIQNTPVSLTEQIHKLNRTITNMKLELISFQRRSWFISSLARSLNDCMEDEYAFLLEAMENMRELRTNAPTSFSWMNQSYIIRMRNGFVRKICDLLPITGMKKWMHFISMTASL